MQFLLIIFLFVSFHLPAHAACTNPDGVPGELMYNDRYDVFQGCTLRGWKAFHAVPPDCPNPGDTCRDDGTIYIGKYEGHKLFVTALDAPGQYSWNDGSGAVGWINLNDAFMPNCPGGPARPTNRRVDLTNPACNGARGKDYTTYLANFSGAGVPYKAASYCYHLGKPSDPEGPGNPLAHGHNDWYLPAIDELEFIHDSLGVAPNIGFKASTYWSSTESNHAYVWDHQFGPQPLGGQDNTSKDRPRWVRCFHQG